MKNEPSNIISSAWLRSLLFPALVYFSQIYPSYQLDHFHEDSLLGSANSSHSVGFDVEHSSDHHHDEDHQHTFNKHIDWHIIRIQAPGSLKYNVQYNLSSIPFIPGNDDFSSCIDNEGPPSIQKYYTSFVSLRAPPLV